MTETHTPAEMLTADQLAQMNENDLTDHEAGSYQAAREAGKRRQFVSDPAERETLALEVARHNANANAAADEVARRQREHDAGHECVITRSADGDISCFYCG